MWQRQKVRVRILIALGVGLLLVLIAGALGTPQIRSANSIAVNPVSPVNSAVVESIVPPLYDQVQLPHSIVHTVTITHPQQHPIQIAVGNTLERVESVAQARGALAALNAGFFDPNNEQTTSYVVVDGNLIADPRLNQRLVGNPDLVNLMDQILNRSEFRHYDCEGTAQYDIQPHTAAIPSGCRLVSSVGAGPQLLPKDTSYEEAFIGYGADGRVNRDALGSQSRNARSAIGIKSDGSVVLVMAAQRSDVSPSGLTFAELAEFMRGLSVEKALNLDGGSSASLFFEGATHYGRLDRDGHWVRRPVKSVLFIEAV